MLRPLCGLLFAVSCSTLAIAKTNSAFDGFYVGAGAGAVISDININAPVSIDNTGAPYFSITDLSNNQQRFYGDAIGQLFLGYGIAFSNFYLGGEIYGAMGNRKTSATATATSDVSPVTTLTTTTDVDLSNGEFGVDLRPGVLVDDQTLVYGRVGAAFTKEHFSTAVTGTNDDDANGELSYNGEKHVTGLRLGLGMEHKFMPNLSLRTDYIFTHYGSISGNGSADFDSAGGYDTNTLNSTTEAQVRTHTVLASLSYYFG